MNPTVSPIQPAIRPSAPPEVWHFFVVNCDSKHILQIITYEFFFFIFKFIIEQDATRVQNLPKY